MRLSLFGLLDRGLAPAPAAERVAGLRGWIYAHRGLHGKHPENSCAAFAAAADRGLGVECDVQLTADGKAVVFHDFALERLTGCQGAVIDHDAAALCQMRLGGSEQTVPTLATALGVIAARVPLLIELKSKAGWPIFRLCAAVQRALHGYRGIHAVMSFDPRVPAWFSRQSPQTPRGLVVSEAGRRGMHHQALRHLALWQARPDFLAYDIRDMPSTFAAMQRRRGMPVMAWTVRSPDALAIAAACADAPIVEGAAVPPAAPMPWNVP